MKRTGNLLPEICDLDNLYWAFYKAQKAKWWKPEVMAYAKSLSSNLYRLREEIRTGDIVVGAYRFFTIYDPKKRQICAAPFPERVLHHAIMNVCHPVFEKLQIFDSYATRKHKGTYAALDRARFFQLRNRWYVKMDIRKYFDSIDHHVLYEKLERKFKDRGLLRIFRKIIDTYEVLPGKGLPIGNLTSQYFANYYLSFADRYVQQELKIGRYVRYMDDMVFWGNDKKKLLAAKKILEQFLREELLLTLKVNVLQRTTHGLPFLGYRLFKDHVRLSKRSKLRLIKKANLYEKYLAEGQYTQSDYHKHILPLLAYAQYADSYNLRSKVFASSFNGW